MKTLIATLVALVALTGTALAAEDSDGITWKRVVTEPNEPTPVEFVGDREVSGWQKVDRSDGESNGGPSHDRDSATQF